MLYYGNTIIFAVRGYKITRIIGAAIINDINSSHFRTNFIDHIDYVITSFICWYYDSNIGDIFHGSVPYYVKEKPIIISCGHGLRHPAHPCIDRFTANQGNEHIGISFRRWIRTGRFEAPIQCARCSERTVLGTSPEGTRAVASCAGEASPAYRLRAGRHADPFQARHGQELTLAAKTHPVANRYQRIIHALIRLQRQVELLDRQGVRAFRVRLQHAPTPQHIVKND